MKGGVIMEKYIMNFIGVAKYVMLIVIEYIAQKKCL